MRIFDVGIAPTDMRDDAAAFAAHGFEQLIGGVYRIGGRLILDEDVRGAADRPSLVAEEDIAVAAHTGVARPFVARQTNKLTRSIEPCSKFVQPFPKRIGNLKIIALVTHHVDEGLIACIAEIVFRGPHSDGFATLAMQIGPIAPQRRGADHAKRVGLRDELAIGRYGKIEIAGVRRNKVFDSRGPSPFAMAMLSGRPLSGRDD